MEKINYNSLNSRQKESYNYQKLSGILADYGYTTYRMHDDYNGADFHAIGVNGEILKVQLKTRVTIHYKYYGKDLFIGFSDQGNWYLYPHDEISDVITNHSPGANKHKARSIGYIPNWLKPVLNKYMI